MIQHYQRRYITSTNLTDMFDQQPLLTAIYNLIAFYEEHSKVNKNLTCKLKYDCDDLDIYGDCPESEEDYNRRMARIKEQDDKERAEYERLKAKFETNHGFSGTI